MDTKFTPGPWTAHADDFTSNGTWRQWRIWGPENAIIAEGSFDHVNANQSKPNAQLIASAPDLYATLNAVYARFRADNTLASAEWCKHEIAAALAKARGE